MSRKASVEHGSNLNKVPVFRRNEARNQKFRSVSTSYGEKAALHYVYCSKLIQCKYMKPGIIYDPARAACPGGSAFLRQRVRWVTKGAGRGCLGTARHPHHARPLPTPELHSACAGGRHQKIFLPFYGTTLLKIKIHTHYNISSRIPKTQIGPRNPRRIAI